MRSPAELTELFRSRGLKVTPQRLAVFQALHGDGGHPSAEAVWGAVRADLPTVSLRTVYQTLNDLVAMGEVGQLDLGTGSARFDPNLEAHHHLVCQGCGWVLDVDAPAGAVALPPGAGAGFLVTATEVVFRGLCASCQAAPAPVVDPDPVPDLTQTQ